MLPVLTWWVAPASGLYAYRDCYSENVLVSFENDRDVVRVSRFWIKSSLSRASGSYQASLYFYQNGILAERKSLIRTFNAALLIRQNAVDLQIENVGFISGIHDEDPRYRHYLDAYMQKALKSHIHLFSDGRKLMAGLAGRPRLICNRQKKTVYPLR
jgi:hypothetical protein